MIRILKFILMLIVIPPLMLLIYLDEKDIKVTRYKGNIEKELIDNIK